MKGLFPMDKFQSTFPQGERQYTDIHRAIKRMFQSTFPQGERRERAAGIAACGVFQSTFPQGERRRARKRRNGRSRGFNPRSRKGNDRQQPSMCLIRGVSIHVPARGTTAAIVFSSPVSPVSIHVPARGTTRSRSRRSRKW